MEKMNLNKALIGVALLISGSMWVLESVSEIRDAEASGSYTASPFRRAGTGSSPSPSPSVDASGNPIPVPSVDASGNPIPVPSQSPAK